MIDSLSARRGLVSEGWLGEYHAPLRSEHACAANGIAAGYGMLAASKQPPQKAPKALEDPAQEAAYARE